MPRSAKAAETATSPPSCVPDHGAGTALATQVMAGLTALIRHAIPDVHELEIDRPVRSAGGLSRENWSFDARWRDADGRHEHRLMLMRDAAGTLLQTDRMREYHALKALEGSAVPAPRVFWADPDGRFLAAPSLVMERVCGACDYMVLNAARPLAERIDLASAFLDLMIAIQAVDWRRARLDQTLGLPSGSPADAVLAEWESEYRRVQLEPHPELDFILARLRAATPESQALVLVHGDFKPGNALIDGPRITAKLDWETAHLGDPLEDLGWVTNPVRRREHQIPRHWERGQIVDAYRQRTGRAVDETHLTWWNVFSCWKLSVIQLTAVHEFVSGRYDRVFQTPSWLYRPMLQMLDSVA